MFLTIKRWGDIVQQFRSGIGHSRHLKVQIEQTFFLFRSESNNVLICIIDPTFRYRVLFLGSMQQQEQQMEILDV